LFLFNNSFLFLLRNLWFIGNIDEFFLFLRLIETYLFSKFLNFIVKYYFGSLVKELELGFLDEDFDNFV